MATAYDAFRDLDRVASARFDPRGGPRRRPLGRRSDSEHSVLTASPARSESVELVER